MRITFTLIFYAAVKPIGMRAFKRLNYNEFKRLRN